MKEYLQKLGKSTLEATQTATKLAPYEIAWIKEEQNV